MADPRRQVQESGRGSLDSEEACAEEFLSLC